MLLLGNGRVITRDPAAPWFPEGGVLMEGEAIREVGPTAALRKKYPQAQFIDARGGLILPGFINAHTHIYSGLARGLSIRGYAPTDFLSVLEGMWWNIDRRLTLEGTQASAKATLLECIRNGVTTIFDHHASFCQVPGSLFTIARECERFGVRACLCYEVSERDGAEKCREAIAENADFARFCRDHPSDMLKAMFGGHALFTISDETFRAMVKANDGMTGFHIHVSEGMNDVVDSREKYGCLPVDRLYYNGILGEKTLLGHCIHLSPAEMDLIAQTGTMVVNNPESNMGNAVGCAPVLRMLEKGVLVGMGTDAYTHDMLESLKVALLIQRHNAGQPGAAWGEVTSMLFANNAKIAERYFSRPLGVLKPGAAADVIVMDYPAFTPLDHGNIDGHAIFGLQGHDCRTTVINGRVVYKDREFLTVDAGEERAFCLAESKKLWGELNHV